MLAVVVDVNISRPQLKWGGIYMPWNRTRMVTDVGICWLNGEMGWARRSREANLCLRLLTRRVICRERRESPRAGKVPRKRRVQHLYVGGSHAKCLTAVERYSADCLADWDRDYKIYRKLITCTKRQSG